MGDDLANRRPQDASRINIHEPFGMTYWTKKCDCSQEELIAAVNAVGTGAKEGETRVLYTPCSLNRGRGLPCRSTLSAHMYAMTRL